MNETASDNGSDTEARHSPNAIGGNFETTDQQYQTSISAVFPVESSVSLQISSESDFLAHQSKLQIEARNALTRAKEVAQMEMQIERQKKKRARISDLVRQSLEKVIIYH